MKVTNKRKRRPAEVEEAEHGDIRAGGDVRTEAAHGGEYIYDETLAIGTQRDRDQCTRLLEDRRLGSEIDGALAGVDLMLALAHEDDAEIARLGEETRRLIGEMRVELKAA